jgi:hypothetical protein
MDSMRTRSAQAMPLPHATRITPQHHPRSRARNNYLSEAPGPGPRRGAISSRTRSSPVPGSGDVQRRDRRKLVRDRSDRQVPHVQHYREVARMRPNTGSHSRATSGTGNAPADSGSQLGCGEFGGCAVAERKGPA